MSRPPKKARKIEGIMSKFDTVRVNHKGLVQRSNSLQVKFVVTNHNTPCALQNQNLFVLNSVDNLVFQVRVIGTQTNNGTYNVTKNYVLVRFYIRHNNEDEGDVVYMISLNCAEFSITDKTFFTDDGTWHLLHECKRSNYSFLINLTTALVNTGDLYETLYDDSELTDFMLQCDDGAVSVHKAVFAAASPVFRRMLAGPWKETAECRVTLPGISKNTVENLKEYIYCHSLPSVGLEQLMLLASYYMMPDLEQQCVELLMKDLDGKNAFDLLEFASKNKVTRLVLAILDAVQDGEVLVKDIRTHACSTSSS